MTKKSEARMLKCSELGGGRFRHSDLVIPSDFVIRHSGLRIGICHCIFKPRPLTCRHVNKVAFHLGNFTIYWFGVLVALAVLAGLWTASRRAALSGIRGEIIVDLGPWLILGTIIGARGLFVISYWREEFASDPWWQIFNIRRGGLVFYGGLIGASLSGMLYV